MATQKDEEVKDTGVPTNDAYTGMLVISLLALIVGSVLLYLDRSQYPAAPPPRALPSFEVKKPGAVAPVAPGAPGVVPPVAPPGVPPAKDAPPPMPDAKKGM